ncbi:MAG: response regulator transcription factor [Acidobacteria bacterium]|nr:response regulator transcription factor [Acidobacteriota bacterium]MXZ72710.1 response regulator transcription factor [Acidobacteriota bacterium]MYD69823.1 response regulator transcription factor [Acidobacteriota bacterium]MYJ03699.1 response regulator transcription factor [Acidobacteriota bacterium]
MRLLVVEDEPKVADALRDGLESEGYDVAVETDGDAAFARLASDHFDLLLLDLTLPGRDGLDVLAAARRLGITTPAVALTARDTLDDRVAGLDAGADDYLVKPFAFAELLARIRAISRRGRPLMVEPLTVDTLTIDIPGRQVTRAGRVLDLTSTEFALIACLARYAPGVVTRDMLIREVWPDQSRSLTLDNVIDVHVSRLRRKVDAAEAVPLIRTVRGIGLALRAEENAE